MAAAAQSRRLIALAAAGRRWLSPPGVLARWQDPALWRAPSVGAALWRARSAGAARWQDPALWRAPSVGAALWRAPSAGAARWASPLAGTARWKAQARSLCSTSQENGKENGTNGNGKNSVKEMKQMFGLVKEIFTASTTSEATATYHKLSAKLDKLEVRFNLVQYWFWSAVLAVITAGFTISLTLSYQGTQLSDLQESKKNLEKELKDLEMRVNVLQHAFNFAERYGNLYPFSATPAASSPASPPASKSSAPPAK